MVLACWYDAAQTLFQWSLTIKEASRILKNKGTFIFDYPDSKDTKIEYLSSPDNAPYSFVNRDDIERMANHFDFIKLHEFVNTNVAHVHTRYQVYQKRIRT